MQKATFTTPVALGKSLAAFLLLSVLPSPPFLLPFISPCIPPSSQAHLLSIKPGAVDKERKDRIPTLRKQTSSHSDAIEVCTT